MTYLVIFMRLKSTNYEIKSKKLSQNYEVKKFKSELTKLKL